MSRRPDPPTLAEWCARLPVPESARLRAALLAALSALAVLLLLALLLAPGAVAQTHGPLVGDYQKLHTSTEQIFRIVRNFLFAMSGFALLVLGGGTFFGRFNAKLAWSIGGGVVVLALAGVAVNQFISGAAIGTAGQAFDSTSVLR